MKIFVLTGELTEKHGWGRYSIDLIGAFEKQGVEVVCIERALPEPLDYFKNYFFAPWYAWKLKRYAEKCDVVHAFLEPYSHVAYWLAKFTGKRYFVTAHGTFGVLPFSFPFYKRYFHKRSFKGAEKIICVSHYTKKRIAEFGSFNFTVINNGIDYGNFYQRETARAGKRENFILSVGALKHRKGYHVSIPAFANAKKTLSDLRYYIVGDQGDSTYFNQLKRLVSDLSLEESIVFLSSISDKDLVGLYEKAKLFMLLSVSEGSNFEGFGLVYLEANAAGLPVIGSLDSGAEDAIKNGETGFLVPQNNPEAAADAIIKVFESNDAYEKMAENGLAWAKEHDWSTVAQEYIKIYRSS